MSALKSTSLLIGAHLVAWPVRYLVGRWDKVPVSTILAFNAVDITANMLARSAITFVSTTYRWKAEDYLWQLHTLNLAVRILSCITAYKVVARRKEPMPKRTAVMTNLSAFAAIVWSLFIIYRFYPEMRSCRTSSS
jgi:hypothetical protein